MSEIFEGIYRKYYKRLYNYAYMKLLNHEEAEDVTADIFLAVFKNFKTFDASRASLNTWIYTIAHNMTLNWQNKAHFRYEQTVETIPDIFIDERSDGTIENPSTQRAERILQELTEQERTFLALRYEFDLKNEEIAKLMNTTAGNISQKYHRLLEKCRRIDSKKNF